MGCGVIAARLIETGGVTVGSFVEGFRRGRQKYRLVFMLPSNLLAILATQGPPWKRAYYKGRCMVAQYFERRRR